MGSFRVSREGSCEGSLEGSFEGSLEGSLKGFLEGSLKGFLEVPSVWTKYCLGSRAGVIRKPKVHFEFRLRFALLWIFVFFVWQTAFEVVCHALLALRWNSRRAKFWILWGFLVLPWAFFWSGLVWK